MKNLHTKRVLCRHEDWDGCLLLDMESRGDTLALRSAEHSAGRVCLRAADSGEDGFRWGRISVGCRLPEDSMLHVYAYASDHRGWGVWPDIDGALPTLTGDDVTRRRLDDLFGPPVSSSEDFYAGRTGRYLWLMLELLSSGREDPVIESVTLRMSGDHMSDYLPAIYREEDFTRRFLSVFDSLLMDMEEQIGELPHLLDYRETDEGMLRTMADWICLDARSASRRELTEWIGTALEDYETMYTVAGVKRTVKRLTGRDAIVIENAAVSPNRADCRNPELYRRLYGDDPYRFFILLEEDTFPSRNRMEAFLEQMKGYIPAGTALELVLLKKCVQLDWHTYLGVNSIVSSYVPVTIDENTTIHYDTMIGGQ